MSVFTVTQFFAGRAKETKSKTGREGEREKKKREGKKTEASDAMRAET